MAPEMLHRTHQVFQDLKGRSEEVLQIQQSMPVLTFNFKISKNCRRENAGSGA